MSKPHVTFIGLGAIGLPMAKSLLRAGVEVRGFDLRAGAREAFASEGGQVGDTAVEAARDARALILMVVNIAQVDQVLFEGGALDALVKGGLVILAATCPATAVTRLGQRIQEAGYLFLDAPVSGGTVGAERAALSIMAAGSQEAFDTALPLLQAMGNKIFHVGTQPGQASAMKTVNQLLCGVHIAATAEALALAENIGVDAAQALEVLKDSAASSWMLRDRGLRMLEPSPEVTSTIDIFVKDLSIVVAAGAEYNAFVPLAELALSIFRTAAKEGLGQQDDSQIIKLYRHLRPSTDEPGKDLRTQVLETNRRDDAASTG